MVDRKAIYTKEVDAFVNRDVMWNYLTWREIPLSEALMFHLVMDQNIEKSRVAELLNVSPSRVSHAVKVSIRGFRILRPHRLEVYRPARPKLL